jgi:membrane peptidoglycan carboxypeptidase
MATLKDFLKSVYPVIAILQSFKPTKLPKYKFHLKPLVAIFGLIFFAYTLFYYYILKDLPSPSILATRSVPLTTHIRDRNGRELYKIYSSQNRTLIKLSDLPEYVKQATLAIEDKNFYSHPGFSTSGIIRAFIANFKSCGFKISDCHLTVQGGSTITQQLVKTSLLTPEKTFSRKLRELILSVSVESKYTKEQILEMYLNRVSYGGATYGIEEAAQTYFGISAAQLTLPQAALLAGLPASPTTYSPYGSHPELAKERQKEVLNQMVSAGYLSANQAKSTSATDLIIRPQASSILAPHFVMYVKELLSQKYGSTIVEQGGLDVTTTLDLDIQDQVQKIVSEEVAKVANLHIQNGASLVTIPSTGEIISMVGSKNYFDTSGDGNVNVTLRPRQPGSSIKPINYALAFTKNFTPSSLILLYNSLCRMIHVTETKWRIDHLAQERQKERNQNAPESFHLVRNSIFV